MAALQNLCQSAMLIRNGRLALTGPTDKVIATYLEDAANVGTPALASRSDRQGSSAIRFFGVRYRRETEVSTNTLVCGAPAVLELHFENRTSQDLHHVAVSVGIDDHFGQRITCLNSEWINGDFASVPAKTSCVELKIPRLSLAPGRYGFTLYCAVGGVVADWIKNAGYFDVEPGDFYGTGKLPPPEQGFFLMPHSFHLG